jgi:MacB-like periplasmic core domain
MARGFLQDVRYAVRVMLKSRAMTLVAMVTLALGIGANTAIFSVINALLLRPLPYGDPDRLVMVWQDLRPRGGPATEWTGPANHVELRAQTDVFDSVTSIRGWNASLSGGAAPEAFQGEQTTYEYFDVLGTAPELGPDVPAIRRCPERAACRGAEPHVVDATVRR